MSIDTPTSLALRDLIDAHRDELEVALASYGATNPRLFGSVARGDAGPDSDVDILVDLIPDERDSDLFRVSGFTERFRRILGYPVDVVTSQLLRERVAMAAEQDAVPLGPARAGNACTTSSKRSRSASAPSARLRP